MALETDPYFRRGVEAQQGRVTCPRSRSWLRLSQVLLLWPEIPALPSGCTRAAWGDPTHTQMRILPTARVWVSWEVFVVAE